MKFTKLALLTGMLGASLLVGCAAGGPGPTYGSGYRSYNNGYHTGYYNTAYVRPYHHHYYNNRGVYRR